MRKVLREGDVWRRSGVRWGRVVWVLEGRESLGRGFDLYKDVEKLFCEFSLLCFLKVGEWSLGLYCICELRKLREIVNLSCGW